MTSRPVAVGKPNRVLQTPTLARGFAPGRRRSGEPGRVTAVTHLAPQTTRRGRPMSRFDLSVLENAQKVPGKPRHKTREVRVGSVVVGGSNPIWVQSMTTTDTFDVDATVAQIHALEEAGCELVRVT